MDGHGKLCPRRVGGKNVYTKAGGCLLLNNASFHCLTSRRTTRQRRNVRVRYRQPEPVESGHSITDPYRDVAHFTSSLPDRPALRLPGETGAVSLPSAAQGDWRRPGTLEQAAKL